MERVAQEVLQEQDMHQEKMAHIGLLEMRDLMEGMVQVHMHLEIQERDREPLHAPGVTVQEHYMPEAEAVEEHIKMKQPVLEELEAAEEAATQGHITHILEILEVLVQQILEVVEAQVDMEENLTTMVLAVLAVPASY